LSLWAVSPEISLDLSLAIFYKDSDLMWYKMNTHAQEMARFKI